MHPSLKVSKDSSLTPNSSFEHELNMQMFELAMFCEL